MRIDLPPCSAPACWPRRRHAPAVADPPAEPPVQPVANAAPAPAPAGARAGRRADRLGAPGSLTTPDGWVLTVLATKEIDGTGGIADQLAVVARVPRRR